MSAIWEPLGTHHGRLALGGMVVDRITFDFGVEFTFSDGVSLTVETFLRITAPAGLVSEIKPSAPGDQGVGEIYKLLRSTVDTAIVADSCTLVVRFTDGATLEVPGEQRFEAWQFHTDDHEILIAMPGDGGLAYWSPESSG